MDVAQKTTFSGVAAVLARFFANVREAVRRVKVRRLERSLHVCETLALGERRFLLLVQCEQRRYLIGAGPQGMTLIDQLDERANSSLDGLRSPERLPWKALH